MVTSCEVSYAACERERSTPEKLAVICGASQQFLKSFLATVYDLRRGRDVTDGIRANLQLRVALVDGRALGSHLVGQRYWVGPLVKRARKSVD